MDSGLAEKRDRERDWYRSHGHQTSHPLNSTWLYSPSRNDYNYIFPKTRMAQAVDEALAGKTPSHILVAPLGRGEDLAYVKRPGRRITGVDTSPEALQAVTDPEIAKLEGDLADLRALETATFDVVLIPLIFHHYVRQGFDPFVREAYRLLKPGGSLISLEPSSLNPMSLAARMGKSIFGNITGQVEDEAPFPPARLARSFRRCGLTEVRIRGAGFAHNRVPIPLAKAINALSRPVLDLFPFNHLAWMCVFTGRKPA
jgi:SAM-dependent methyltransferase